MHISECKATFKANYFKVRAHDVCTAIITGLVFLCATAKRGIECINVIRTVVKRRAAVSPTVTPHRLCLSRKKS
jgi:hypothetical protein